jgi:hypothetical protein
MRMNFPKGKELLAFIRTGIKSIKKKTKYFYL